MRYAGSGIQRLLSERAQTYRLEFADLFEGIDDV